MAKFLVIAEKPSVAQSLAKNLSAYQREDGYLEGNSCIVSWCLGHLAEYAPPEIYDEKYEKWQFEDLPIIPEVWKVQVSEDKKKQFEVLCSLMNREDVAYLVNGCDAGREGELIFKRVYDLAGCQKPVKRLWISSMEDEAIQKGFQTLKDGKEYAGLCNAAVCRAQADWLIGMNATRAYTTRYFKRLVVGRVQTPTLSMLTERKEKIEHFKKEAYYKVSLSDGKLTVTSENIQSEADADELRKLCDGEEAMVSKVKKAQKRISPPKLYDLTSLQREANRYFGYTAQKTLDAVVLEAIQKQIALLVDAENIIRDSGMENYKKTEFDSLEKQLTVLHEEVERYKDLKTRLYQDMLDNIVTREEYHEYNQRFSDKLHNAEEAKRELEKKKEKAVVEGKREHPWIEDFKSYQNITQLDRKAVVTLIDKIIVYGKDRLEIQFKYADEIQEMTEVAQNIREIEEKEGRFKCGA